MPKRTNPFQQLTTSIFATVYAPHYLVEESVIEINKKTGIPREIDVRITDKANPDNKILIECRDHQRKQNVTWVDAVDGKARSLGFKKVILISRSGFSKSAEKEANSRGIQTMHLKEAEDFDWKRWLFAIKEFGVNIDFEPVVKRVTFYTQNKNDLSLEGTPPKGIFFVDLKNKKKISLKDYILGLRKDPKIVNYVRSNNTDEAISHYDYEIPCDEWIGLFLPRINKVIPLQKVLFSFDSVRRSYSIPLTHIRLGDKKILTGTANILGNNSRVVLEERKGQVVVMIEQRIKKN